MMGTGSFENGGRSTSSNLSALAPPFTVDRSFPKPNTNPLWQFSDSPFVSSFNQDNRQYPKLTGPVSVSNSVIDSVIASTTITDLAPSSNDYKNLGLESENPTKAYWPLQSPRFEPAIDAFSYSVEPSNYYHQHVLTAAGDATYDMSTSPGLVSSSISSQVENSGMLSSLEYWGRFWDDITDDKQGKLIDLGGNIYMEEADATGSLVYKNENAQGTCTTFPASCSQMSYLESGTNPFHLTSSQKGLQTHTPSLNDFILVTKPSPTPIIRQPPVGTSLQASKAVSSKPVYGCSSTAVNKEDHNLNSFVEVKAPAVTSSAEGKEGCFDAHGYGFPIAQKDHIYASLASSYKGLINKPLNDNIGDLRVKAVSTSGSHAIEVPAGFSLAIDGVGVKTAASTDCLDNYNPSVDSPCWKGSIGFQFSEFGTSEAENAQHPTKNSENCSILSHQEIQTSSYSELVSFSSPKPCERRKHNETSCIEYHFSLSPRKTSDASDTAEECRSRNYLKPGTDLPQMDGGFQFATDINKPINEYDLASALKKGSALSHAEILREKDETITVENIKPLVGVACNGIKNSSTSGDSCVPSVESVSRLLSSSDYATNIAKPLEIRSTEEMEVQMLINTLHNLSELLLLRCSTDSHDLTRQDRRMLDNVMYNVHACLPMRSMTLDRIPESLFSQDSTFEESPDCHRLHGQLLHEGKGEYNASVKRVEKCMESLSLKDGECTSNRTIRNVLDEICESDGEMQSQTLLYKKLWLDAEAELCSINCRARLELMKTKMKCNLEKTKGRAVITNMSTGTNITPLSSYTVKGGSPSKKTSGQDPTMTDSTVFAKNVDPSVMDRFQILKGRNEGFNSVDLEKQQQAEFTKINKWPSSRNLLGDVEKATDEDYLRNGNKDQVNSSSNNSVHETSKGYKLCVTADESSFQTGRNSMMIRPSNFPDIGSLEWEHVLKDDYTWFN